MKTAKKWKEIKHFGQVFNFLMFEIALALIVVMFGVFGISSMFPVGMSSQKEAVGTSYITDAAEQLLRLNASYIKNDWEWLNIFADAKPDTNDQGIEWTSASLFQVNQLRVKPETGFDSTKDENSGLFLIEQVTLGTVDQAAILRMWKEVKENENESIDAIIYAEVSWPAEKPYYARDKEIFSLQISKAPEAALTTANFDNVNCTVEKLHGGGYSTTISSVIYNGDSNDYTIELIVSHNGCVGSECPGLSHFSVEAEPGTYSNVMLAGVSGVLDLGPELDDDDFDGFKVDYIGGMGNGNAGTFTITYTLPDLQEQHVVAHCANDEEFSVRFTPAEFDYVLHCSLPIYTFPCRTMFGVYDDEAKLFYYSLNDDNAVRLEGEILGISGEIDLEALTLSPEGIFYLINNEVTSQLYIILPEEIDKDPETPVNAIFIGDTGLMDDPDPENDEQIGSLQFINGVLYSIGITSGKIYTVNPLTAAVTEIDEIDEDDFYTDGLTLGADGEVYLNKTLSYWGNSDPSELWRFTNFPDGDIEQVMVIAGSGKVEALTAHPDGSLYAADDDYWYRLDPVAFTTEVVVPFTQDTEGLDFFFNSPNEQGGCE